MTTKVRTKEDARASVMRLLSSKKKTNQEDTNKLSPAKESVLTRARKDSSDIPPVVKAVLKRVAEGSIGLGVVDNELSKFRPNMGMQIKIRHLHNWRRLVKIAYQNSLLCKKVLKELDISLEDVPELSEFVNQNINALRKAV